MKLEGVGADRNPARRGAHPAARAGSAADLLSALRFAMAALWTGLFASGYRAPAGLGAIAICAAATDVLDGWAARRMGTAREAGQWVDSLADITFVLAALGCEAWVGALPAYIPLLIALSFAQYAIDSIAIGKGAQAPIRSRLGHWGGMLNFALAIALAVSPRPGLLGTTVQKISPAIAAFYIAAIAERAIGYFKHDRINSEEKK